MIETSGHDPLCLCEQCIAHDPLCACAESNCLATDCDACDCALIARVREDERDVAREAVAALDTEVFCYDHDCRMKRASLAAIDALKEPAVVIRENERVINGEVYQTSDRKPERGDA